MTDREKQRAIAQFVLEKARELRQGILEIAGAPPDAPGSIRVGPHTSAAGNGIVVAFRGFADNAQVSLDLGWCQHVLESGREPPIPPSRTLWVGNN